MIYRKRMGSKIMLKRKDTGSLGEKLAREHLKKKGYRILETNYHCRAGEIDIVAKYQDELVFIEVRTKTNLDFGSPEESITEAKMEHLRLSANRYLQEHNYISDSWRIDVVVVELTPGNKLSRIEVIENAIEE
jgi:putative endonuclease